MRRRQGKVNRWVILLLGVVALTFFFFENRSLRSVRSRLYDQKLAALQLAARAFEIVRDYRLRILGLPIDSINDPNSTGLIGLQYTQITYGRSNLSDALTTTNPNFSAALVEMLSRTRVKRGDTVAVNWDGTYPALNISVLAAAKVMGFYPIIVTAQSAGMWGANCPDLTWLDMEQILFKAEIWDYRTIIATASGEDDNGRGSSPEGRELLTKTAELTGVAIFTPESITAGVARRMEVFARCRALIAIGLPVVNSGDPLRRVRSGLLFGRRLKAGNGLIAAFLNRGLPVVHIANPSQIAIDYRLPVAPVPLPDIGKGRLFYERRYSVPLAIVFTAVLIALLTIIVRYDVEYYLGARGEENGEAV